MFIEVREITLKNWIMGIVLDENLSIAFRLEGNFAWM